MNAGLISLAQRRATTASDGLDRFIFSLILAGLTQQKETPAVSAADASKKCSAREAERIAVL